MKQSIKPIVWGPHGWKFMHYVSLGYPQEPTENDKRNYKDFYTSLQNVLPCATCQGNYKKNLSELPIDNALQSRDSLVKWVIDIHNKVNKETNKRELGYDEAIQLYLTDEQPVLEYCFKILVLLIILYFLYRVLKK